MAQAYWEISKKLLIVPYVPGSTDAARPLLGFEQPIMALEERQTLLFMRATCLPFMWMYPNNTRITTGKARRRPDCPEFAHPTTMCINAGKGARPACPSCGCTPTTRASTPARRAAACLPLVCIPHQDVHHHR